MLFAFFDFAGGLPSPSPPLPPPSSIRPPRLRCASTADVECCVSGSDAYVRLCACILGQNKKKKKEEEKGEKETKGGRKRFPDS